MSWLGKWRNQYGSILEITDESNHRIVGTFRTGLQDSTFADMDLPVVGMHQGDCIGIAGGAPTLSGDVLVTYTGLLREEKLETMWYVVSDAAPEPTHDAGPKLRKLPWWRSMLTNADTFVRVT